MSDPFSFNSEGEPSEIILGSFVAWRTSHTYDAALYRMEYVFRNTGPDRTVVGSLTDGVWSFSISGSVSSAWTHGPHTWDLNLVRLSDSEKIVCASGFINFFQPTEDRRSLARIMLAKIESILTNRADSDVESYTIGSRSITKIPLNELITWRDHYRSEIAREESGGRTPTLRVRFV